ncbi:MAG: cyclopropane fatty acyl phospholipid synthase [Deltaproteobacteria bacterium]|nr:cyclopropane fatty acyl phospholipid synthase [Deltaproteobacteria bacterium]
MVAETIRKFLGGADIAVNGDRPWDIQVRDERWYRRVWREKNLGLGESYMDGWWHCRHLDEMVFRLLRGGVDEKIPFGLRDLIAVAPSLVFNLQSCRRSRAVAERHYDLDNELFFSFLDPFFQYSCGFFEETEELDRAQEQKMELICRKLHLGPSDRVLDIGCGWGGLARYMAERRGCAVTGVNISREQLAFAERFCQGLPVTFELLDYRQLDGRFDKIVSVGMFEHVGYRNHRRFMKVVQRCLKPGGLFLLQTIGNNLSYTGCDPWITRYIFPNGVVPSIPQIAKSVEGLLVIEDLHALGPHYDKTLMAWNRNFQEAWGRLRERYEERFKRMWEYYLLSCAGAFRARSLQTWQIVMSRFGSEAAPFPVRG